MPIVWRASMEIDHGVIDHDHQVLIAIINEFTGLTPKAGFSGDLKCILGKLGSYIATHFDREEVLQEAVHYPQRREHLELHKGMAHRFNMISDKVAAMAVDDVSANWSGSVDGDLVWTPDASVAKLLAAHKELNGLLCGWLVEHIVKSDLTMKPYVAAMAPHSQAMPSIWQAKAASLSRGAAVGDLHRASPWTRAGFRPEPETSQPNMAQLAEQERRATVLGQLRSEALGLGIAAIFDPNCNRFRSRALEEAAVVWRGLAAGRVAPRRTLTPAKISGFEAHSAIFHRVEPESRYVAVSAGKAFADAYDHWGGHFVDEVVPHLYRPAWLLMLDGALSYGAPLRVMGPAHAFGRDDLIAEYFLAPLLDDGGKVADVLLVAYHNPRSAWPLIEAEERAAAQLERQIGRAS